MKQVIIQIKGVPGSGKSYICSKIPRDIKCFDTDYYITKAYKILRKKKTKITINNVPNLARKLLLKDIKGYPIVVIVGITFEVSNLTKKYFIKMSKKELDDAYRRTVIREIKKYNEITKPSVIKLIEKMNNNEISEYLRNMYHINAMDPVETSFDIYKKRYKNALAIEKKRGFIIKNQRDIINDLNHL